MPNLDSIDQESSLDYGKDSYMCSVVVHDGAQQCISRSRPTYQAREELPGRAGSDLDAQCQVYRHTLSFTKARLVVQLQVSYQETH